MGVKLAFRLQKIEQIEDKTITLRYNRQAAVQRSYAPQGLIGLLAGDLSGPPNFINVDLDAPFFREIDIDVDAPVDFGRSACSRPTSSSSTATRASRRSSSARTCASPRRRERGGPRVLPEQELDLDYRARLQYHFDPLSGWEGGRSATSCRPRPRSTARC